MTFGLSIVFYFQLLMWLWFACMPLLLGCEIIAVFGLGCFLFAVWLWSGRFAFTSMLVLLVVGVEDVGVGKLWKSEGKLFSGMKKSYKLIAKTYSSKTYFCFKGFWVVYSSSVDEDWLFHILYEVFRF